MKKNILTSLVALAALVGFTSCDQDNIGPKFEGDLNNSCLFAEESMTAFVEPEQNTIPVKVSRLVAESAVDVPIVKINVPDGVTVPESVHFDADETESAFIIVVDDLTNFRADKSYPIELRFDNDHALPSETGQLSIYNGLCELEKHSDNDSIVLVHDGVRPFVNDKLINDCIESVVKFGSAITVVPAIETIVSIEQSEILTITDRSKCYHAKAPQCFFLGELIAAHRKALQENITTMIDCASLMKYYGHSLYTVPGNYDNIKITTPTDFYTSRALYEVRENQQIFGL